MIKSLSITALWLLTLMGAVDYGFLRGLNQQNFQLEAERIYRMNTEYVCNHPGIKKMIDKNWK